MELEEAVKNLNDYIFAIDNFGTIDPKCCNNLYEPTKVILKELINKNNKIDKTIKYIKEKQKIQYKYTLSKIEIDELLKILEG